MHTAGLTNGNGALTDSPYSRILNKLVVDSQALTALLISKQGIVVACAGETSYFNPTSMAALVAGMFTATREVARMVGEDQFSILLQQGEVRHLHISLVTGASMMMIVFEDNNRIGLIRHCAKKAADQLGDLAQQSAVGPEQTQDFSLPKFKEYAFNLIDRIFEPQPE
jgi:predicted regulator of Ras-like GTPase activity (Roadblock/LC7/MglB family)